MNTTFHVNKIASKIYTRRTTTDLRDLAKIYVSPDGAVKNVHKVRGG